MVDMAHFAGLVAAGLHPNPVPHADVVTTTTHKTLARPAARPDPVPRGVRARRSTGPCSPAQQGGPLMHVDRRQGGGLRIAASEPFRARQRQTSPTRRRLPRGCAEGGIPVLTGGTDVHLALVDLRATGLDGRVPGPARVGQHHRQPQRVPFDQRPPINPSGLRIGTPALTTRGMVEEDMREIAAVIATALSADFDSQAGSLAERSKALMDRYPLYPQLAETLV